MSRIHEALKKAEQERGAIPATEPVPQHLDVAVAPASTPVAFSTNPETTSPATAGSLLSSEFLRFDDLRTHCAHPEWVLDPNVNVFFNPGLSPHGAEQFRTLRSRLYQIRATQPLRTLLVTSSVPGEGKTFITNNLAQAIVRQPDRRVLMI